MKRLFLLLALLAPFAGAGEVCSTNVLQTCSSGGSSGTVTGPAAACTDNALPRWDGATTTALQCSDIIVTDAEAVTGITTLTGTDLVGTTTVSGGAASTAANSVWLSSNTINAEGATANTAETTITFGDPTADQNLQIAADSNGMTLTASTAASNLTLGATNNIAVSPTAALTLTGGTTAALTAAAGNVTITATMGTTHINLTPGTSSGMVGVPSVDAANAVMIGSGTIVLEGPTADAAEMTIGVAETGVDGSFYLQPLSSGTKICDTSACNSSTLDLDGTWTVNGEQGHTLDSAANNLRLASDYCFGWSSNTASSTAADTTWCRSAAGVSRLPELALTASTMTAENSGTLRETTHSYTWTNAQVAALAGTAGDINVVTLPAKTQVVDAAVVITGAAVGPATVTVSCGDAIAGTPFINLIVASDAKAAANTVYGDAAAERGTSIDTEFYYLPSYTATTLVTCHFISTVANLSTVTGSTGRVILATRLLP